jgi:hypothetical protein
LRRFVGFAEGPPQGTVLSAGSLDVENRLAPIVKTALVRKGYVADAGDTASCTNNTASVQLNCTAPCTDDLSNIGTGDFHVSVAVTTKQFGPAAILSQRPVCDHSMFWDLHLVGGGTLEMETDDGLAPGDYTVITTAATVNDGNPHLVVAQRVGGLLTISIDGVVSGTQASSPANFGALVPMALGTDVCVPYAGFVGTIANVCVASP